MLCCVCSVLCHLAPVHLCARLVHCVSCAVSWATRFLFTAAHARCVVLCVRCPGQLGSCSPACLLGALSCVFGVLGHLAPVHRCARSVRCVACAVSWATWLLFTDVLPRCVVLPVRCPGPLRSCLPVCSICASCCVCGVLGHLAPVHRCVCSACCVAYAVFWATWLLFTGVPSACIVLRVRCPGPLGSCARVCSLCALCWVCGVHGQLAPVHRCACLVCCVACAVFWATRSLLSGVLARCVVLRVRCPGPLGSCSPVCRLGVLCCVCSVLAHLAPVYRCARSVLCPACAVSWASWLLFTDMPARCIVLRVRCPWPLGSCSPACSLGALSCVCGVLGHLAPVHRCARSMCYDACAVSWATSLLFTAVLTRCIVGVCGVLGHLAPVHRCARLVRFVVCATPRASLFLFSGVSA